MAPSRPGGRFNITGKGVSTHNESSSLGGEEFGSALVFHRQSRLAGSRGKMAEVSRVVQRQIPPTTRRRLGGVDAPHDIQS
jgi:hypothetical protein